MSTAPHPKPVFALKPADSLGWPAFKHLRAKLATYTCYWSKKRVSYIVAGMYAPQGVPCTYNGTTESPVDETRYERLKLMGQTFESPTMPDITVCSVCGNSLVYIHNGWKYLETRRKLHAMLIEHAYVPKT